MSIQVSKNIPPRFLNIMERFVEILERENDELKAENSKLKDGYKLTTRDDFDKIEELKAEIIRLTDKLQAVNDDYNKDHKVHDDYEDGLLEEIKELKLLSCTDDCQDNINSLVKLQAEFKDYSKRAREQHECGEEYERELKAEIKELKAWNEEFKAENKELKASNKRAHDIRLKYASLKEYKAEAEEYFYNNPQSNGLLFFMLDKNDFTFDEDNNGCNGTSGEYNHSLYTDDCLIEIDNEERSN